jgi:hypothetical protein
MKYAVFTVFIKMVELSVKADTNMSSVVVAIFYNTLFMFYFTVAHAVTSSIL